MVKYKGGCKTFFLSLLCQLVMVDKELIRLDMKKMLYHLILYRHAKKKCSNKLKEGERHSSNIIFVNFNCFDKGVKTRR